MHLTLERCTVRPWRWGDEGALTRAANDVAVWRNLRDRFPHPYTFGDACAWITHATTTATTAWAIEVGGEAIGAIGLELRDDVYAGSAEIGFWLARAAWGRGIMTEAVSAVTPVSFQRYGLARVYAHVFAWNPASARVLEKAGYQREAVLRRAVVKDGQRIDALLYARVRDEPAPHDPVGAS